MTTPNEELESKRQLTIVYSRVVGWLTPVSNYNLGKIAERADRVNFIIKD